MSDWTPDTGLRTPDLRIEVITLGYGESGIRYPASGVCEPKASP